MAEVLNLSGRIDITHDLKGLAGDAIDMFERDYKKITSLYSEGKIREDQANEVIRKSWQRNLESDAVSDDFRAAAYRTNLAHQVFRGEKSYNEFKKTIKKEAGDVGTFTAKAATGLAVLLSIPFLYPKKIALDRAVSAAESEATNNRAMFKRVLFSSRRLRAATKSSIASADDVLKLVSRLNAANSDFEEAGGSLESKAAVDNAAKDLKLGLERYKDNLSLLSKRMSMTTESIDAARNAGVKTSVSSYVFQSIGETRKAVISHMSSKFDDRLFANVSESIASEIKGLTSKGVGPIASLAENIGNQRGALSAKAFIDLSNGLSQDIAGKMSRMQAGELSVASTKNSLALFVEQMNEAMDSRLPVSGNVFARDETQSILSSDEIASMEASYQSLNRIQRSLCAESNKGLVDRGVFYASGDGTNSLSNYNASIARSLGKGELEFLDCLKTLSNESSDDSSKKYARETLLSLAKVNAVDFGKFDIGSVLSDAARDSSLGDTSVRQHDGERMKALLDALSSPDQASKSFLGDLMRSNDGDSGGGAENEKVKKKLAEAIGKLIDKLMGEAPSQQMSV